MEFSQGNKNLLICLCHFCVCISGIQCCSIIYSEPATLIDAGATEAATTAVQLVVEVTDFLAADFLATTGIEALTIE